MRNKSFIACLWIVAFFRVSTISFAGETSVSEMARFHHVHLNVTDPDRSLKYYQKFFSAVPIIYRKASWALLTDRSYFLFTKVPAPPPWELKSAIYHVGWGGIDGPSEFEWRKKAGMEFETELTPLGSTHFMYAYGPDKEVIEIWCGFKHQRFGHVHLLAEDVNATVRWYVQNLGLKGPQRDVPKPPPPNPNEPNPNSPAVRMAQIWASQVSAPNVTINIFGRPGDPKPIYWKYPPLLEFEPTQGRVIDHIAFSFPKIDPVFERLKNNGVEIVKPIAQDDDYKMRSFFVMGPDKVLIEIVEEKPMPEGSWE